MDQKWYIPWAYHSSWKMRCIRYRHAASLPKYVVDTCFQKGQKPHKKEVNKYNLSWERNTKFDYLLKIKCQQSKYLFTLRGIAVLKALLHFSQSKSVMSEWDALWKSSCACCENDLKHVSQENTPRWTLVWSSSFHLEPSNAHSSFSHLNTFECKYSKCLFNAVLFVSIW